jgi:type II secretory pathway component GspD/PulD (secretin)
MIRLATCSRSAAVALVALVLASTTGLAAPATSSSENKNNDSPAEKLRAALDQKTDVVIDNQPLDLAINQLGEQTKINFVIDRLTIQQLGIDPQASPVTLKLQGVKLRTALRSMLGQYNLSYAIVGEAIHITSEDMAMFKQMKQRVSIDLDREQMGKALTRLAKETATNLLVDARVLKDSQTPVTLQLDDVPLETAVRLMAEMAGLKPVRVGNVLFVTSKANANEMKQDADLVTPPAARAQAIEELIQGGAIAMPAVRPPLPVTPPAANPPPAPSDKTDPPPDKPADEKKPATDKDKDPKPPEGEKKPPADEKKP